MKDYRNEVVIIKEAILRSQYRSASRVNADLLSLYYGIGSYVSYNSRGGYWGTGAIDQISSTLQKELPGLRGFSAANVKKMRIFYEEWSPVINRSPLANDLQSSKDEGETNRLPMANDLKIDEGILLTRIRQPSAEEFNGSEFIKVGFSHHMEILFKAKSLESRLFYIHECATRFWNKYTLREYLQSDLYGKRGTMPSNFSSAIPDAKQALRAISAFKDEYLLDYINVEQLDESEVDQDERVLEGAIVREIKKFIMTLGTDFIFIGNQYRIEVAGEESFIDLLFFNRELNALVALELKRGKFRPSYLGQLNYYLSVLDDRVRKSHERSSIGIILCRDMDHTIVEYAVRDFTKPMGVSTYHTSADLPADLRRALPDMESLKQLLS